MANDKEAFSWDLYWSVYASTGLRQIWKLQMAWGQISFLLGVLGNIFTLYATVAHNAIKLDKMSIWIIKNLAVADICNCFLVISQYGKFNRSIILGETFHKIMAYNRYLFFVANLFLVNILSLNKLIRCLFPLRNLFTTKRQKNTVSIATILISVVPTLYKVYGIKNNFENISPMWQVRNYFGASRIGQTILDLSNLSEFNRVIRMIVVYGFNALPCLTLVLFNSSLIIYALFKANISVNKKNILAVILVTIGFLISILPHFVYLSIGGISHEVDELTWSITYLSIWINPIIYLAVNPSFRRFTNTMEKLCLFRNRVRPLERSQPPQSMHTQESAVTINNHQTVVIETQS